MFKEQCLSVELVVQVERPSGFGLGEDFAAGIDPWCPGWGGGFGTLGWEAVAEEDGLLGVEG